MMKQKGIILGMAILVALFPVTGNGKMGAQLLGTSVWGFGDESVALHLPKIVLDMTAGCALDNPILTTWIDPGMVVATGVDLLATKKHDERTIDAADAISDLKDALGNDSSEESTDGSSTSGNTSLATVYTADEVFAEIELNQKSSDGLFDQVRSAINKYLFETADAVIKGGCTQSDKDCATARQNEWLLASVALASATADKVLDQTASSKNKKSPLVAHFQQLASSFNAETSPMGLYNKMADIVLDTHRQINDANALMGRDLEAQGLVVVTETGPVLLDGTEE